MNYKRMTVWSGGNKEAKDAKKYTFIYSLIFIGLFILHIAAFAYPTYNNTNGDSDIIEPLIVGGIILVTLGWITLFAFLGVIESLIEIKLNKLITLYLYDMENFIKMGEIPENMCIVFLKKEGVVLGEKANKYESLGFTYKADHFSDFIDYYDKKAVEKEEIHINI